MFLKAPVRRFNESTDSTPPPGSYDPKFTTDLSVSASCNGNSFNRSSNCNLLTPKISNELYRSRPSSPSPASSQVRLRSTSTHRSLSNNPEKIRRNTSQPPVRRIYRVPTFIPTVTREFPTQTSTENLALALEKEPGNSEKSDPSPELLIQLELLQKNLDEEKKKVASLEEQRETLESMLNLSQSEINKHEEAKGRWESAETAYSDAIQMLQTSVADMEQLLKDAQSKYTSLMEEQEPCRHQIATLQKENLILSARDQETQEKVKHLQQMIEDQEAESGQKCQILVEQMDNWQRICEDKVAVMEAEKEKLEQQVAEFPEKIQLLQKEMDQMRFSLDSEKTRREIAEKELSEIRRNDNQQDHKNEMDAWTSKENNYLKTIAELNETIQSHEARLKQSEDFYFHAISLKINDTKNLNEQVEALAAARIQPLLPVSEKSEAIVESESHQAPESTLIQPMEINISSSANEVVPKTVVNQGDEVQAPEPEIRQDRPFSLKEELKRRQLDIALKEEEHKLKIKKTKAMLKGVLEENKRLEELKRNINISSPDNNNNRTLPELSRQKEDRSSPVNNQAQLSVSPPSEATELALKTEDAMKMDTVSGKSGISQEQGQVTQTGHPSIRIRIAQNCETEAHLKRSPRRGTPTPSGFTTTSLVQSHHSNRNRNSRRRNNNTSRPGSTNMLTSYLSDVAEEEES